MDNTTDDFTRSLTQKFIDQYQRVGGINVSSITYLTDDGLHKIKNGDNIKIIVYQQNGKFLYPPTNFFHLLGKKLKPGCVLVGSFNYAKKNATPQLSKAEFLGLLIHGGFSIIEDKELVDSYWFAAEKKSEPGNESEIVGARRLLFTQERVGKHGKIIKVYKLRTMYPLSHLIQEFLLRKGSLGKMGKISDDFRITPWGKWIRKYWLDELPQIINILKGEMAIVGLRPLSKSFFRQLPEDLQDERVNYLPGLIPPVYADRPKNLKERIDSERTYLRRKKKYGLAVDLIYLFRVLHSIIFKGQRGD